MQPDIPQRPSDAGGLETSIVNTSLLDQSQLQEMKKREVKVQKVLESYETTFREQAQELQNYKTKIKLLEEKTCFEDRARELEIQLENLKTDVKEKEVVNSFEMKQLKDRVSIAMSACDSANKLKDEAVQVKLETEKKLAEMTSRVLMAEEDCAANYESVVRLTEKLKEYHEKEDEWKERFGREMEAKAKLEKSNKELEQKFKKANADNARLAGHQNLKQKIQYINDMKKDYQLLKEENQKLNAKYQKLLCEKSEENRKPLTIKNENV